MEQLAAADLDMVAALRKAIAAVQEHLNKEVQTNWGNKENEFGVSQNDVDDYVEKAIKKENDEDIKPYSLPSERLLNDVGLEIDISEHKHTLCDNDIRHIFNSHGEKTKLMKFQTCTV